MKNFALSFLLLAALALGQTWVVEQIDSTAASGSPVELVKAANGKLWTGYQTKSGVARVACLGDSGWSKSDIRSANVPVSALRPFLAASPHGELCLSCYSSSADSGWLCRLVGDTWHEEPYPFMDSSLTGAVTYDTAGRLYTAFLPSVGDCRVGHETDSGWTSSLAVSLFANGYYWVDDGCLTVAADGSPWYFAYVFWQMSEHVWGEENALMHCIGDTWVRVDSGTAIPLALVPHGDSVGWVTVDTGMFVCDGDTIASGYDNSVAGLAYTVQDVPLVAWVPRSSSATPVFAFKTDRWRTEDIPGPAGIGGLGVQIDTAGQVVVMYSTQDSGLWCAKARVSDVVGVKQVSGPIPTKSVSLPTVVRGVLFLPANGEGRVAKGELLNISGRKVLTLHPGANDVRALAPGVYFVREAQAQAQAQAVRKVVVTR